MPAGDDLAPDKGGLLETARDAALAWGREALCLLAMVLAWCLHAPWLRPVPGERAGRALLRFGGGASAPTARPPQAKYIGQQQRYRRGPSKGSMQSAASRGAA